jgi:DNA modification methylase
VIPDTLASLAVPVAELRPFHRNPRRRASTVLRESLEVHGQYRPVVVNVGTKTGRRMEILAGNGTYAEAVDLGWSQIAATFVDVDDDEASRIVLVDNRANDLATYDNEALTALLQDLGPDLTGTGFSEADLLGLIPEPEPVALTDPDDAPPRRKMARSKPGELYLLGPHRLVVGDATMPDDVDRALGGEQASMVFTDPPYGVDYVGKTAEALTIANDALAREALTELLDDAFAVFAETLRPGGAFYICSPSGDLETVFRLALRKARLRLRQQLVWVKNVHVMGRSDYHLRHETMLYGWQEGGVPAELPPVPADEAATYDGAHTTVLYGWQDGKAHTWEGGRRQNSVWEYPKPTRSAEHPTMKPVALVSRALENSCGKGDLVLDPFAGSGTTLIAAHLTGRRAAVVELDPSYADVICTRYQRLTGVIPINAETGEQASFADDPDAGA